MNPKQRGSEKLQFSCGKTGVRSIEDFQNVEELLEARGGADYVYWWKFGVPAIWKNLAVNTTFNQTLAR